MANRTCPWQVDTLYPAQGGPYFHEALNKIIGTEIVARQPVHGFLCIDKEVHLYSRIDYQIYTCIVFMLFWGWFTVSLRQACVIKAVSG